MSITVACSNSNCAKKLRVKEDLAGKRIRCPACGEVVGVPGSPAHPAVPSRPAPDRPAEAAPPAMMAAPDPVEGPARFFRFLEMLKPAGAAPRWSEFLSAAGPNAAEHFGFWLARASSAEVEEAANRLLHAGPGDAEAFNAWWIDRFLRLLHPGQPRPSAAPLRGTCVVCGADTDPLRDLYYFHAYVKRLKLGTKYHVEPPLTLIEKTNFLFVGYREGASHVCAGCVGARRQRRLKITLIAYAIFFPLLAGAAIFDFARATPPYNLAAVTLPFALLSLLLLFGFLKMASGKAVGETFALESSRDCLKQAGLKGFGPGLLRS